MTPEMKPSQRVALLAAIAPVSQAAGSVSTSWVPLANFNQAMAVISAGVLGASATLGAKIEQATDAAGTGAKDVTGKAITNLVKATDDGKQAIINLRAEELDVSNRYAFIRLTLAVGTAASLVAASLFGLDARQGLASDNDAATVKEIVG